MIFFRNKNKTTKKARNVFRPALGETTLEERVVMSVGASHVSAAAVSQTGLSAAQVRAAYAKALHNATSNLRQYINAQAVQLYANGKPTADQLANFKAQVAGAVNATAFNLSSQESLLPRSSRGVAALQNSLLGSSRNSLMSRIDNALLSNRNLSSATSLENAIGRGITTTFLGQRSALNNFFNTTPLNQLSVDANGNHIGLQQFLGGRALDQFSNSLGSFASAFPNVANSMLFPGGVNNGGTPDSSLLQAFNGQTTNALGTITAQLANNLSLFPNSSGLASQLNPLLFGTTGSGANTGFLSSLQNLQFGGTNFNNDLMTAFNNGFSNFTSPLNSFFGLQGQQNATLPTTGFNNIFGSGFTGSGFNNGFNNGFATGANNGFIGFGQAPTGFNNAFATGFNGLNNNINSSFGFNFPTLGGTSGFGGPGGVGIGTGIGGTANGNFPGASTSTGGTGAGAGTGGFFV